MSSPSVRPIHSSNRAFRTGVRRWLCSGIAVAGALSGRAALADPCSVTPTFTVTVGARQAPAVSQFLAGDPVVNLAWTINATATAGASCSNLTESSDIQYGASLATTFPGDTGGSNDTGTDALDSLAAGKYTFQGTFACDCGLLGGPSQNVTVTDVVVPPTILQAPQIIDLTNYATYMGTDTVPTGANLRLQVGVENATLCPTEALTYHLSGAGVDQTVTVSGPDGGTDCNTDSAGAAISFTPTSAGTLTLVANFQGAASNPVTWTVGAGAGAGGSTSGSSTSGNGGAGGSGSTTGGSGNSKGGCQTTDAGCFGIVALAGLLRRTCRRT